MTETQRPLTARETAALIIALVLLVIAAGVITDTNPLPFAWDSVAMLIRATWEWFVTQASRLFG